MDAHNKLDATCYRIVGKPDRTAEAAGRPFARRWRISLTMVFNGLAGTVAWRSLRRFKVKPGVWATIRRSKDVAKIP